MMHLMRCQTQHDYRTRLLIEETNHVKKSSNELAKEPHAAREPGLATPALNDMQSSPPSVPTSKCVIAIKQMTRKVS